MFNCSFITSFGMEAPRVDGLNVLSLIGYGECGRVYLAHDDGGRKVAVKLFEALAIHRTLLAKMTGRLENGGWPAGVMPVYSADFEGRPSLWVTPLHWDDRGEGEAVPRTLQRRLAEHPGEQSWPLVRKIAAALANMHERQVAHGNLKPGNVFFDENDGVLLSDWTLGNMPGVSHMEFTDALLYQPPDQLKNSVGYLDEAGYRWDVFSFGVLGYRILTGKFPRCNETFSQVAPPPEDTRRDGIHADLPRIAKNIEKQPDVSWPDEPVNELEAGFREWIDRCLNLDPVKRPATMVEVVAGFDAVELRLSAAEEREHLMNQRRHAEHKARRMFFIAGVAGGLAVMLGALWQLKGYQLTRERDGRRDELETLRNRTSSAVAALAKAEKEATEAKQNLSYEKDLGIARLEGSRLIADRLFSWAMEKGHRRLPPLDGRELRLKRLERYFEDFLTRTADIPALSDERARVLLQLAEVSIAEGDAKTATIRLSAALEAWKNLPVDGELRLRMATNSLLLALLHQSTGDEQTGPSFITARTALETLPHDGIDAERLNQLLAILDFHEAQYLSSKGNDTKALEQLLRATENLNHLADQRPDAAVLRSELAACYLSSATILEGMGSIGDAREVRSLAATEIAKLLKNKPQDFGLRMDLAGCYAAMAEAAVLSGDTAGAETLNNEALKMLDRLLGEQPDNAEASIRKATQVGVRAGILRDRGQAEEAMKHFDDAIRMLEAVHAASPGNAMAAYRLALLWWQKGRVLGTAGKRNEEISFETKARDLLSDLETKTAPGGPRPEQLQSSGAYLLGDLGLAQQLAGRKEESRQTFSEAVRLWESLLKSRPQSEEFDEGLAWCRQRLAELQ